MPAWLTLPNLFTLMRLALAPLVFLAILNHHAFDALALFAVAAATDSIDGYLARYLQSATAGGAFFDPIADKVLMTGVYLGLALEGSVPWWFAGIIFGRDILILAASLIALGFTKLRAFPPSRWGKASTFLQILTAVSFLGRNAFGSAALIMLSAILIWPAAALTLWSGVHYGYRGARSLRND
jgi:cardiolipin synthase